MKKCLKTKSSKSTNTDTDERFEFRVGPYVWYLTKKDIAKIYQKRRKTLNCGHCVRCGKELKRKKLKCTNCKSDMLEYCFEDDLKKREEIIEKTLETMKWTG